MGVCLLKRGRANNATTNARRVIGATLNDELRLIQQRTTTRVVVVGKTGDRVGALAAIAVPKSLITLNGNDGTTIARSIRRQGRSVAERAAANAMRVIGAVLNDELRTGHQRATTRVVTGATFWSL